MITKRNSGPDAPPRPPSCAQCGFLMCEESDYREERGMTLAIPNGKYSCLHCKSAERTTEP